MLDQLKWIPLVTILSISGASLASAAAFTELTSVPNTTSDSSIHIEGVAPLQDQDIFVTVLKEGSNQRVPNSYYGSGPRFSKNIYLPLGAGTYEILVFGAKSGQTLQDSLAQYTVKNTDTRDLKYLLPSGQVESDAPEIIAQAKAITAGLTNDYDRTKKIHDWVASNVTYDINQNDNLPLDALGTLELPLPRPTDCQGYATLLAALNRAIGLPAKVVEGQADSGGIAAAEDDPPHVWNEVEIDGRWVTEDAT